MTKLSQAIKNMERCEDDYGEFKYSYLQLPSDLQFVNINSGFIFVREDYESLMEYIMDFHDDDETNEGILLSGNPGIGKSVGFLNFVLWYLAQQKRFVVFESIQLGKTFCFDFRSEDKDPTGYSYWGRPKDTETPELRDRNTFYLVDPAAKIDSTEPRPYAAFTLLASSPNLNHYEQYIKRKVTTRFLSVWSELECHQFVHHMKGDHDVVARGIKQVACTPRNLCMGEIKLEAAISQRDNALSGIRDNIEQFVNWFDGKAVGNLDSWGAVNHRLFHIYADKKTFLVNSVEFASKEIELECILLVQQASHEFFTRLAFSINPLTSIPSGNAFEKYCHDTIPLGGLFKVRILAPPDEPNELPPYFKFWDDETAGVYTAEIPKMFSTEFDPNPKAGFPHFSPVERLYYIPSHSNFKSADSLWLPNMMLQITIEKKKKTLNPEHVVKLLGVKKLDILYAVPDRNFSIFTASIVDKEDKATTEKATKELVLNSTLHRKYVLNMRNPLSSSVRAYHAKTPLSPSMRTYHTACRWLLKMAK